MIITAFRTGPTLASTGLLPECKVLGTEECAYCGLPYILVLTDAKEAADEVCNRCAVHFDLLRKAITNAHAAGHPNARMHSDGITVQVAGER